MAAKKITKKKVCTCCGEERSLSTGFYSTMSTMFALDKRINICKNCFIDGVINKDTGEINEDKFKNMLQRTDFPYYLDNLKSAENQYAKENGHVDKDDIKFQGANLVKLYMKNVNTLRQLRGKTFSDSERDGFIQKNSTVLKQEIASNRPKLITETAHEELVYSDEWIGNYTQKDLVYLNKYYTSLKNDYKILTENHRDYARKIAKASLQMDKAFDDMINGVTGADAKYKNAREAFDTLSKSAKFSESTRSVNDVGISSFSKITEMVENHNWIPEHKPIEKDEIDKLLDYLSTITKSL